MNGMSWPYYDLGPDGTLYEEDGSVSPMGPFTSVAEAEQFLEDNDLRGNVRVLGDPSSH
jgi:hypothetical protein